MALKNLDLKNVHDESILRTCEKKHIIMHDR